MPQFELILERVHLYLVVRARLQIWMKCPRKAATLFELRLSLMIEIFVIWSESYINHLTRLQSKLDNDFELTVLKVTTRRASTWVWIDTFHDHGQVRKWPLQMPSLLPFLRRKSGTLPRGISGSRSLRCRERSRMKWELLGMDSKWLVSLQVLSCSGVRSHTVWQSFKCVSRPVQRQSNYRLSWNAAFEVSTTYLKWQCW